jgi:hypothetical protein
MNSKDLYWVGFLLGDGTVTCHPNGTLRLKLALSVHDKGHLKKFANWFGGNYTISEKPETGMVSISVYDQEKIEWLIDMGVEPNKTDTVTLPDVEDNAPLIRGYSDADGYIGAPGGNGYRWSIASNSETVLEQIKEIVPINGGEIVENETAGTNYLRYGKLKYADSVADFLYPEGIETEPALNRKKESAVSRAAWLLKKMKDMELENYA